MSCPNQKRFGNLLKFVDTETCILFLPEESLLDLRNISNKQQQTDNDDELSDSITNCGTKAQTVTPPTPKSTPEKSTFIPLSLTGSPPLVRIFLPALQRHRDPRPVPELFETVSQDSSGTCGGASCGVGADSGQHVQLLHVPLIDCAAVGLSEPPHKGRFHYRYVPPDLCPFRFT